jgi:hypothetical protein
VSRLALLAGTVSNQPEINKRPTNHQIEIRRKLTRATNSHTEPPTNPEYGPNKKMSSTNQHSKPEVEPKDKTDYAIIKEGGWDSMHHFMISYGLKMHDDEDYAQAKQIVRAFRQHDQKDYEARQQEKNNGK